MSTTTQQHWTVRELKSGIDYGNVESLAEVGLLSEDTIDYLYDFKNSYEQEHPADPTTAEETDRWRELVEREVDKNLRKAVKNGRSQEIAYKLGLPEEEEGYSPYVEYEKLRNILLSDENNSIIYAGGMGSGKTADALRVLNFLMVISKTRNESIVPMVNEKSVSENQDDVFYVASMWDVMDVMATYKADRYVLIIDEASSFLTGYGTHMSDVSDFRLFVRRARKMGLLGVYIGHRLTDITPDIRDLDGTNIFWKPDQERMLGYTQVQDADDPDAEDARVDLRGLDDTEFEYNTDGFAPWTFDGIQYFSELINEQQITGIEDFREIYLEDREEEINKENVQKTILERMQESYQGQQCCGRRADGSRCQVVHGMDSPDGVDAHLKGYGLCERHLGVGEFEDQVNQHELTAEFDKDPYEFSHSDWQALLQNSHSVKVGSDDGENDREERCIGRAEDGERCPVTDGIGEEGYCSEHREQYFVLDDKGVEKDPYRLSDEEWDELIESVDWYDGS